MAKERLCKQHGRKAAFWTLFDEGGLYSPIMVNLCLCSGL